MMRPARPPLTVYFPTIHGPLLGAVLALVSALAMTGCAKPLVLDATLPQQFAEISCLEECRIARERCEADARYEYRQCQAGHGRSFEDYRWCLASASDRADCGYPWWPCAENLYGLCFNRHNDCKRACEG